VGTNYYVAKNLCECCNRYDEEYHIGKASYGWAFSFQGYRAERLVSWRSWKEFLKDKIIIDEYGERTNYDWFVNYIEENKSPGYVREDGHKNLQHNEQGKIDKRPWFNPENDWDDEDGYAFCAREFS
jgi:hypothetical protein